MARRSKTSVAFAPVAPAKLMAGLGPALTLLLVPQLVRAAPVDGDIHSLRYNFTIPLESSSGQPWCVVQGQLDADNFLSYDCGSNIVKDRSTLGMILSATETWKDQIKMLKEAGDLFRPYCPDIKLENLVDRGTGSVCLQVMLTCKKKSNGDIYGFWEFGRNGQIFLTFHPESEKWEMEHSRAKSLKEKWEKDSGLIKFLKSMSMGDCKTWLNAFVKHQDRNASSISSSNPSQESRVEVVTRNPTDVSISAPPTTASRPSLPAQHSSTNWILAPVLIIIIIGIASVLIWFYHHRCKALCDRFNMPKTVTNIPMETSLDPLEQIDEEREESTTV